MYCQLMSIFKSKAQREQTARILDLQDRVVADAVLYVKEQEHPARDPMAIILTRENLVESVHLLREERGW